MREYKCWDTGYGKRETGNGKRYPLPFTRNPRYGFTLLEILLVTVILSIVGLSIYGAFNNGIKVWKRIVKNITQEDVIIFFEKISHDLKNTFQYTGIKFEGTEEKITFPTLVAFNKQGVTEYGIGCVTYFGDGINNTVNREQMDYSQLYQNITPPARKLVTNIENLIFQYYYYDSETEQYCWKSLWEEEEELPLAVKIKIEFYENGNKNSVVQTIFIPVCKILKTSEAK